jgi:nucleotide-binding universal stress UspA family protein
MSMPPAASVRPSWNASFKSSTAKNKERKMYKDIMLALHSYPRPTPDEIIEQAVEIATVLDARLTAVTFELSIPAAGTLIADYMLRLADLMEEEQAKSQLNARSVLQKAERFALAAKVDFIGRTNRCSTIEARQRMAEQARTYDLVLARTGTNEVLQSDAEAIIFESGRPVLLLSGSARAPRKSSFENVVVAWDFGRAAARALGDAMPILRRAKEVRVVTARGEKRPPEGLAANDIIAHLAQSGVTAILDEVNIAGESVGDTISSYVTSRQMDLLVMGSYGRPRAMEFLLGGATKTMIANPPCPVLMSH